MVIKNQGNCHFFSEIKTPDDPVNSFTTSYSVRGQGWVFFHDYIPDFYVHTREQLFTIKNNSFYKHNAGNRGTYYGTRHAFFIDVLFRADTDLILETVNWISEVLENDTEQPGLTLDRIHIWNSHQHSGPVDLQKIQPDRTLEMRRTRGEWSFNDFRNILISKGTRFLESIFKDMALITAQADQNQAWYRKELLSDRWFCVRFEFDNVNNRHIILHDTSIQAQKSDR